MKNSHKLVLAALIAFGALAGQACSNDADPEPSDPGPITPSTGGKTNNSGGGNSETGGNSNNTGGGGGGNDTGGVDNQGGDGPGPSTGGTFEEPEVPPCPEAADEEQPSSSAIDGTACWNIKDCKGTSDKQFLEQCNGTCYPFDNEARIAGYDGTLPPL
jgi:hypothetical protein